MKTICLSMIVLWAAVVVTCYSQEPQDLKRRTWTSADGRFSVDATFLTLIGGVVSLERHDGKTIAVRLEQLSEEDQKFVRERGWLKGRVAELPEALGEWDGFRGIRWGTHISEVRGMSLRGDDLKGLTLYTRRADSLSIGDAELVGIAYGFYKSRFYFVRVSADGSLNWPPLRRAVFARYGEGVRPDKSRGEWRWYKEDVIMRLTYDSASEKAALTIVYTPIGHESDVDRRQREKEAADQDF